MFAGSTALNFIPGRGYISPADGLLRFEFSDEKASLTGLFNSKGKRSIGQYRTGLLGDILQHDELYRHYPEIGAAPFELYWMREQGNSSLIKGQTLRLLPALDTAPEKMIRSLCHEIQHIIQLIEGFSEGGSPNDIFAELRYQYCRKTGKKYPPLDVSRALNRQARQMYRNLPGEKEARDVAARRDWTMEQRNAVSPVNAKLANDETGVSFAPRPPPTLNERLALAFYVRKRRQLTGINPNKST